MSKIPQLKEQVFSKFDNPKVAEYFWEIAVAPQLGYAFSLNHSLPYSFVAIQMIYLVINYNPIYWDTACLIVNSGSLEDNTEEAMNGLENSINDVDYKITPIVLFEGSTNGDITLRDDISNYRIIKIYYKDNDGASYCRTIGNHSKENTLKIALDAYYNGGVYFNLKLRMYAITGKTMTGTGQINYEFSDKSISYNNSIVINRIEGYE